MSSTVEQRIKSLNEVAPNVIAEFKSGSPEAFDQIYLHALPIVYSYMLNRFKLNSAVAEDLTSEVMLKVLRNLGKYEQRNIPFSSWLYRIALNYGIDYLRSLERSQTESLEEKDYTQNIDSTPPVDKQVIDKLELENSLSVLNPDQRLVIVLRFQNDLDIKQTAAVIGRSEEAVKKLQSRGIARLKRYHNASKQLELIS